MSGVDVIGELLRGDAPTLAVVPAGSIKAGVLPDAVALPALLIRLVSSTDRQRLKIGSTTRTTDRVSVTVRAASYREQRAVIKLARKACAGFIGNIGGVLRASVLTAGTGPDVGGPANSFEQTQDFKISFDTPA